MMTQFASLIAHSAEGPWHALRVRVRSERAVAGVLAEKSFECYVPCWEEQRTYSDRRIRASVPAFPGYVFCRFDSASRFRVLNTPGVLLVLSIAGVPQPIEEKVIFALQKAFSEARGVSPAAYIHTGKWVQIVDGPMMGAQGLLIRSKGQHRLVISIELLQRSISVEVDAQSVVPISGPARGMAAASSTGTQCTQGKPSCSTPHSLGSKCSLSLVWLPLL